MPVSNDTETRLGRYVLERKLGTGGMAEVFLARQDGPDGFARHCVVKRMLPHLTEEQAFVEMFFQEAKVAAQLSHPNVAQVYDFGVHDGAYFIAMEYVRGCDVRHIQTAYSERHEVMGTALAVKIAAETARGLDHAHTALDSERRPLCVIHRDVSAHNILVSTGGVVKLIDFGIAKSSLGRARTQTGVVKGKLAYMSPEQAIGAPLDPRSDIYSLALVLFELLTNRHPARTAGDVATMGAIVRNDLDSLVSVRPDLPEDLLGIVTRALQHDRQARYPSAAAFADDLERHLSLHPPPVGAADLARLVAHSIPSSDAIFASPSPPHGSPTQHPITRSTLGDRPALATGLAPTALSPASGTPVARTEVEPAARPRSPGTWTWAAGALLVAAGIGAGAQFLQQRKTATSFSDLAARETTPRPPSVPTPLEADSGVAPAAADAAGLPLTMSERGTLLVEAVPVMVVTIDGEARGHSPLNTSLPAGEHTVGLRNAELGLASTRTVQVRPGETTPVRWRPAKGTVRLWVVPYAEVFLGARSLGTTPIEPVELYEGRYTLRLVYKGRTLSRTVKVFPGAESSLTVNMQTEQR